MEGVNKVVVDPPRSGAAAVLRCLLHGTPAREPRQDQITTLVYVSCNPESLATDARLIVDAGFTLQTVCLADMFPHTEHIEAVCHFTRNLTTVAIKAMES